VNEQCLRLQPQADILEAHGDEQTKVCAFAWSIFVTAACLRCWFDPEK
jgi:hypothetical protein